MPRRGEEETKALIRSILETIDMGARTIPDIAEIAGVDRATVHYYLVRKRGAKGKTLCQQGLVRAITRHTVSKAEGKGGEVFRTFIITAKGQDYLQETA